MSDDDAPPAPAPPPADADSVDRVIRALRLVAAAQLVGFLLFVGGVVLLGVDVFRNHSLDCTGFGFAGTGAGNCAKHSYAWPVGLMIGGFGLSVVSMFISTQYTLKHVGAPVMRAFLARRRLLERRLDDSS